MQRRYLYVLLFALPALLVAGLLALFAFAATAGLLWLFVFGDAAWPAAAGTLLTAVFAVAGLLLWVMLLAAAYAFGRRQEAAPAFDRRHAGIAAAATALLVAVGIGYQWYVDNLGAGDAGHRCATWCLARGFSASSLPPRNSGDTTCTCLDADGRAAASRPGDDDTAR